VVGDLWAEVTGERWGESVPGDVNVLAGRAAVHHALRTGLGLNSDLPGERDVLEQLRGARRLAMAGGTCGRRVEALVRGV